MLRANVTHSSTHFPDSGTQLTTHMLNQTIFYYVTLLKRISRQFIKSGSYNQSFTLYTRIVKRYEVCK